MLLPSDVARLVLGYLQEEGLFATSRAFIHESPNLKEYAEHSTEDGTIPACVFSIFGKGLTTILNEYVASRTKESNHQVPAMMSSLWKKLDFTLNQIKSLQNSPALSACQRIRSRELANIARQRTLANSSTGVTVSETISIVSPAQSSHCIVTHSTPVSFSGPVRLTPITAPNLHSQEGSRLLNAARESPVQMTEHRPNPAPLSPGRRKWKRSAVAGGSSSSRPVVTSGTSPEEETEEIVEENFPQLVIQNARDKILGDRSLQEKLAENINKILASEPTPQSSKACTNIVEPDQSIDEILGLQGEIHMSDDAIHDILEQTESDPAFQALFDLFEYNKTRTADGEPADGDISSSPDECGLSGPAMSSVVKPCQNVESGIVQKETSDSASMKTISSERKTRKSAPVLKKIITSNRSSRVDTCSANLLLVQEGTSASKRNVKNPHPNTSAPMDINEPPTNAASTPANTSSANTSSTSIASSLTTLTSMVSETCNFNRLHQNKATQESLLQPSSTVNAKDNASSTLQAVPSCSPSSRQLSNSGQGTQLGSPYLLSSEASKIYPAVPAITTTMSPSSNTVTQITSTSPVTTSASSTSVLSSPLSTFATEPSAPNKTGDDSSNVVSLKIIVSDSQEENSAADTALSQAVSSISGDKIPTIYLSSPAKPSSVIPSTPKANLDEAAQAVSGLQRSESVIASPLTGTSQPQQSFIIQLPFDSSAASPASFFLTTDAQNRQTIVPALVSKGQAIAPNQFGVSPQRPGFPTASTLILPSPMKPVMLPLSVMGQSSLANVQMVSNQLVSIPNSPVVRQPETVKPLSAGAVKRSSPSAASKKNGTKKVLPSPSPSQGAPKALASPSSAHRRILRFDSPGESQISQVNTSPSAPSSQPLPEPPPQTKPAILTGNKPKRRIEPVRCSDADKFPQKSMSLKLNQTEAVKKGLRKQEHNICDKEPSTSSSKTDGSKPRKRSKSTDGKQNHARDEDNSRKAKESHHSRSLSSDSSQKPSSRKEKDITEKGKSREGRAEKRAQETTSVTANKENELKGQEQHLASSSAAPTHTTTQPKSSKAPSKTSALAKQAAEMLHDIQALNSPSTPKDHSNQEESGSDCPKTPIRTRKGRDVEGTPRHLVPPSGSDIPTCSPASEAGSESSINMAAHTLMILSRAAMARTGTPLKNSLRQEGAGERSPTNAKNTKKRKQSTPTSSPPAKKETKRTPSKKKERKKLMECFPQDLDVDKFLSSLHYDE